MNSKKPFVAPVLTSESTLTAVVASFGFRTDVLSREAGQAGTAYL